MTNKDWLNSLNTLQYAALIKMFNLNKASFTDLVNWLDEEYVEYTSLLKLDDICTHSADDSDINENPENSISKTANTFGAPEIDKKYQRFG